MGNAPVMHEGAGPCRKTMLTKVCGLTRPQDVALCCQLGVDFVGVIFAAKSPRCVTPAQAAALCSSMPAQSASASPAPLSAPRRVGVFVGATVEEVQATLQEAHLDFAQLHGGEDEAFCRAVGPERVIKVLWPEQLGRQGLEQELARFAPVCAMFLLEAGTSGGGSGKAMNWQLLAGLEVPRPWLLAGGLGPHNMREALAACRPTGVDMNSALETAPGIKDHALLHTAVYLRDAAQGLCPRSPSPLQGT